MPASHDQVDQRLAVPVLELHADSGNGCSETVRKRAQPELRLVVNRRNQLQRADRRNILQKRGDFFRIRRQVAFHHKPLSVPLTQRRNGFAPGDPDLRRILRPELRQKPGGFGFNTGMAARLETLKQRDQRQKTDNGENNDRNG